MSNECYFDEELYKKTGHGGHCVNCRDNRGGIHCEQCLPNHYINKRTNRCTACNCDETGSEDLQCDEDGQCLCKPGVTGQFCDRCEDNYYDFSVYGCRLVLKEIVFSKLLAAKSVLIIVKGVYCGLLVEYRGQFK